MSPKVWDHLLELFCHLADAVDGEEPLPKHLKDAYEKAFETPEIQKLYQQLIDIRHECVFETTSGS